jgi:hypothetical protein
VHSELVIRRPQLPTAAMVPPVSRALPADDGCTAGALHGLRRVIALLSAQLSRGCPHCRARCWVVVEEVPGMRVRCRSCEWQQLVGGDVGECLNREADSRLGVDARARAGKEVGAWR